MGESGNGKSTSLRNLPPEQTKYIDCDRKGLPWLDWEKYYNEKNQNYFPTVDNIMVKKILRRANEVPEVKYVVVDTLNSIMVDDEMRRSKEKSYDKWMDLAASIYDILQIPNTLRPDLTVICLAHTQTLTDDYGNKFTKMKTSGKKLDKIVPESYFTTVLLSKRDGEGKYVYEVKANNSTAKTPFGMFDEEEYIDNDIMKVIEKFNLKNLKEENK